MNATQYFAHARSLGALTKGNEMTEYLGCTVGLNCRVKGRLTLTHVEYSRVGKKIALRAFSARGLAALPGVSVVNVTQDEFDDRPRDPYNSLVEAEWAFGKLGLSIYDSKE